MAETNWMSYEIGCAQALPLLAAGSPPHQTVESMTAPARRTASWGSHDSQHLVSSAGWEAGVDVFSSALSVTIAIESC